MDCIAPRPPTDKDYCQLQKECMEIGKPFIALLVDIYNRSAFSLIYSPSKPDILPEITYSDEYQAEAVRTQMKIAIDLHIAEWCRRFGVSDPRSNLAPNQEPANSR